MNPVPLFLIVVTLPLLLGGCGDKPNLKYENLNYEIKDGTVTITDCDEGASGKLVIPATIEGKTVTSIGEYAFFTCTSLTSIAIPDSVTSIGNEAFYICRSLTSITIGNGVTSIGDAAFYSCRSLTSITIGNGVTSIGYAAFWNCTSLKSITVPDGITSIADHAFMSCSSLTAVTFLGDAPEIENNPFEVASPTIIYRADDAKGWGDTFAGRPVKLITEKP